jgi:hypothetical protein
MFLTGQILPIGLAGGIALAVEPILKGSLYQKSL